MSIISCALTPILFASSLPRIFMCALTLRMVMLWWAFFYCVYYTGYKEFVRVVILGGGISDVIEE